MKEIKCPSCGSPHNKRKELNYYSCSSCGGQFKDTEEQSKGQKDLDVDEIFNSFDKIFNSPQFKNSATTITTTSTNRNTNTSSNKKNETPDKKVSKANKWIWGCLAVILTAIIILSIFIYTIASLTNTDEASSKNQIESNENITE